MFLIAFVSCSKTELENVSEFGFEKRPPSSGSKNSSHTDCILEGGATGYKCVSNIYQSAVCTHCGVSDCAPKDECYNTHR